MYRDHFNPLAYLRDVRAMNWRKHLAMCYGLVIVKDLFSGDCYCHWLTFYTPLPLHAIADSNSG